MEAIMSVSSDSSDSVSSGNQLVSVGEIKYFKNKVLGRGGFGRVCQGLWQGKNVAVKKILREDYEVIEDKLKTLSHDNILRYYNILIKEDCVYIAMELCDGTLESLIKDEHKTPKPAQMEELLLQITSGLEYLHSNNIIHRDIKPANILFTTAATEYRKMLVMKLADFGLCKQKRDDATSITHSGRCTSGWAAPESLNPEGVKIKFSADVFSLGCVFGYALTGGCHPFGNVLRENNIIKGKINWQNEKLIKHEKMKNMIREMISKEPGKRPLLSKVIVNLNLIREENYQQIMRLCNESNLGKLKELSERLQTFIDDGYELNRTDENKKNMLMLLLQNEVNGDEEYVEKTYNMKRKCAERLLCKKNRHLFNIYHRDKEMRSALHYLCQFYKGNDICDMIRLFITAGADVNAKTSSEANALLYLIKWNFNHPMLEQAIGTLIENDINVNQNETNGMNALTYLFHSGQTTKIHKLTNILLEAGFDVDKVNKDGRNPLMIICRYGKETYIHDVAKLLIDRGIDVNHTDKLGRNALMHVCMNKEDVNLTKMVTLLLDNGINVNHTANDDWNALMFMRRYGKETYIHDIAELLIDRGIDVNHAPKQHKPFFWNAE